LAGEANSVAANGAALDMLGAGAFATGPAGGSATLTVGFATVGAMDNATRSADDFETSATLVDATITADMAVAVEGNDLAFAVASVAGRALDTSRIAVAGNVEGRLALAIAENDLRQGDRRLYDGIGVEHNLDAKAMIFDLLGNLAVEVYFQGASFLAGGVV
jgi:hypothetical protein